MKNELIHETSPYLLQHAHNPVHWQPWNEQTLQLAKTLDKPILVSIGYSACHWCHVMERESFENEDTAALMNEYFVNIKIDREERPDIDHIYMDAVQVISGSGGWPLNVFLTPDAKPFYGGTYFPPVQAHGRASWTDVLTNLHNAWKNKRTEMEEQAENVLNHLKKSNNYTALKTNVNITSAEKPFTKEDCISITKSLLSNADKIHGGFGKAPKFPQTFSINALLQAALFLDNKEALEHAELCLTKMYHGGIYDQLAGGLCRYSTDEEWLAPHFEKMLYDNALFLISLSDTYLLTKKEIYQEAIESVCNFLFNEMKSPAGGYYAAIDADSEGVEGKFYVWSKTEIDCILGDESSLFCAYYDVSDNGNWEHHNILRIVKPLPEVASIFGIDESIAFKKIQKCKEILLAERNKKIRPGTDDKIILGWNAMLVTAFCKAYAALQSDIYKNAAIELFTLLQHQFISKTGDYYHTYKNGQTKYPAFLDDYANLIDAAIHLQEITSNFKYLEFAKTLTFSVFNKFENFDSDFFFFTPAEQADIIMRKIELYDGATPSANGIMAKNLHYLSIIFGEEKWQSKSIQMLASLKNILLKHPNSFAVWAQQALNINVGINEVVIVGDDMTAKLMEVLHEYIPNKIVVSAQEDSNITLISKKYVFQKTFLYLCLNSVCKAPYDDTREFLRVIGNKVN